MTNFLSQVADTPSKRGQRIVIAGPEKVGKTTTACGAPRSLLVPMESGDVVTPGRRTPMITKLNDLWGLFDEFFSKPPQQFPYRTIVFDTGTALERLMNDETLACDSAANKKQHGAGHSMETSPDGFGKAYSVANGFFQRFLTNCDTLALAGKINIVITCHVFPAKMVDPASGEYDCWDLQLHSPKNNKGYGKREFITQWADLIGFLHEPMYVMKGDAKKGEHLNKGVSANQGRVLGVERTPAWVAGNRYGMTGSLAIPKEKGWNTIAHAIYEATKGQVDVFNRD